MLTQALWKAPRGGASVDPTFAIDEPGYSAYTLEGVPAGPAATPAPEPATWAMMLMGFAVFGYAGYRKAKPDPGLVAPPTTHLEEARPFRVDRRA